MKKWIKSELHGTSPVQISDDSKFMIYYYFSTKKVYLLTMLKNGPKEDIIKSKTPNSVIAIYKETLPIGCLKVNIKKNINGICYNSFFIVKWQRCTVFESK